MIVRKSVATALLFSPVLLTAGCNNSAQVSGSISYRGQPAAEVEVSLESVDEKTQRFTGITREDGALFVSYREGSGMPVGRYKIRVKQFSRLDGLALPAGEEGQAMRQTGNAMGKQYIFEHDFSAGDNTLNLRLEDAIEVITLSKDDY